MNHIIPLIIPNFNQLHYTVNLINWWNYYTANAPVFIIDNASTYKPLLEFYRKNHFKNLKVVRCKENNCGNNLRQFLAWSSVDYPYYCISNPDIMPHPATPENFLELFKHCIDAGKYHHVGFQLKIDDLPEYIDNIEVIREKEAPFRKNARNIIFKGKVYKAFKAPIDLTFSMYYAGNGGWKWPHTPDWWNNSLRILEAYHFGWYIDPDTRIDDHIYYFSHCKSKKENPNIKGVNNYKPKSLR